MKPEVNLYVYTMLGHNRVIKVGRLLSRNLKLACRGGFEGFFQYDPAYLADQDAYAIDPVNLPLQEGVFRAMRPEVGIHGVFSDSLPGQWGERLLAAKADIHLVHYAPAHLLEVLGCGGLGAFFFAPHERLSKISPLDDSLDFRDLARALEEAGHYEKNLDPAELKFLISGGYSAGGARPKLLVRLGRDSYLAKFSSIHDRNPAVNVHLEAAGLELGRLAGLFIPEFRVETVRNRPVLLVKRFDILPGGGRRAMVSFRTLLSAYDNPSRISYGDLAEILKRISIDPRGDCELLFKQMVLNVLIINTDDHLQNFSMIHDTQGWRLSPAYDLVPNLLRDEQTLQVGGRHANLTAENMVTEGKIFGFSRRRCMGLINEVFEGAAGWRDFIQEPGLIRRIESRRKLFLQKKIANITPKVVL